DGWPFILGFFAAGAALWLVWIPAGVLFAFLGLWALWFFRNPSRIPPLEKGAVIAPADGRVCYVGEAALPPESGLSGARTRISIFMNVFNVHVNRAPSGGAITRVHYVPGKFFNASLDKASEANERQIAVLETAEGQTLVFVQIAGLIARRIRCDLKEGQVVAAGERFGLIRFGSRVDVYLDKEQSPVVTLGARTRAGESVIARSKGRA
ncbi:MAG TPA: phosphatidylserine decarboxylase family protein, partial [Sphingomonadales bacterium]|nr:phosphatidylserine decarboxylase family protein [Sphingomonadales bacterium]